MPDTLPAETTSSNPPTTANDNFGLEGQSYSIYKGAASLDQGRAALIDAYNSAQWQDKPEALKTLEYYGEQLKYKFKGEELAAQDADAIAPISETDIYRGFVADQANKDANGEPAQKPLLDSEGKPVPERAITDMNQIYDQWGAQNKKYVSESDDPRFVVAKNDILKSIDDAVVAKKQGQFQRDKKVNLDEFGKYIGENNAAALGSDYNKIAAFTKGAVNPIAKVADLFLPTEYSIGKYLTERQDPEFEKSFGGQIAESLGFVGGAIATGGVGTEIAAASKVGPIATKILTSKLPEYAYLGTPAVAAVADRYNKTYDVTGSSSEATSAAAVETVGQGLQLAAQITGVGKVVDTALGKTVVPGLLSRTVAKAGLGNVGTFAAESGIRQAAGAAVGTVASNAAENIQQERPTLGDLGRGVGEASAVGAITGIVAGGAGEIFQAPPAAPTNFKKGPDTNSDRTADYEKYGTTLTPQVRQVVGDNASEPVIDTKAQVDALGTSKEEMDAARQDFVLPAQDANNIPRINVSNEGDVTIPSVAHVDPSVPVDPHANAELELEDGSTYHRNKDGQLYKVNSDGTPKTAFDRTKFASTEIMASLDNAAAQDPAQSHTVYNPSNDQIELRSLDGKETLLGTVPTSDTPTVGSHPIDISAYRYPNKQLTIAPVRFGPRVKTVFESKSLGAAGPVVDTLYEESATSVRYRTSTDLPEMMRKVGEEGIFYKPLSGKAIDPEVQSIARGDVQNVIDAFLATPKDQATPLTSRMAFYLDHYFEDKINEAAANHAPSEVMDRLQYDLNRVVKHISDTGTAPAQTLALRQGMSGNRGASDVLAARKAAVEKAAHTIAEEYGLDPKDVLNPEKWNERIAAKQQSITEAEAAVDEPLQQEHEKTTQVIDALEKEVAPAVEEQNTALETEKKAVADEVKRTENQATRKLNKDVSTLEDSVKADEEALKNHIEEGKNLKTVVDEETGKLSKSADEAVKSAEEKANSEVEKTRNQITQEVLPGLEGALKKATEKGDAEKVQAIKDKIASTKEAHDALEGGVKVETLANGKKRSVVVKNKKTGLDISRLFTGKNSEAGGLLSKLSKITNDLGETFKQGAAAKSKLNDRIKEISDRVAANKKILDAAKKSDGLTAQERSKLNAAKKRLEQLQKTPKVTAPDLMKKNTRAKYDEYKRNLEEIAKAREANRANGEERARIEEEIKQLRKNQARAKEAKTKVERKAAEAAKVVADNNADIAKLEQILAEVPDASRARDIRAEIATKRAAFVKPTLDQKLANIYSGAWYANKLSSPFTFLGNVIQSVLVGGANSFIGAPAIDSFNYMRRLFEGGGYEYKPLFLEGLAPFLTPGEWARAKQLGLAGLFEGEKSGTHLKAEDIQMKPAFTATKSETEQGLSDRERLGYKDLVRQVQDAHYSDIEAEANAKHKSAMEEVTRLQDTLKNTTDPEDRLALGKQIEDVQANADTAYWKKAWQAIKLTVAKPQILGGAILRMFPTIEGIMGVYQQGMAEARSAAYYRNKLTRAQVRGKETTIGRDEFGNEIKRIPTDADIQEYQYNLKANRDKAVTSAADIANRLRDAGMQFSEHAQRILEQEIMQSLPARNVQITAQKEVAEQNYNGGMPSGVSGLLTRTLNEALKGVANTGLPFAKIPAELIRFTSAFGLTMGNFIKMGPGGLAVGLQTNARYNRTEAERVMTVAVGAGISVAAAGLLSAWYHEQKKKPGDRTLDIIGTPTQAQRSQGVTPCSLQIRGTNIPLGYTPLGMTMCILGAHTDSVKAGKNPDGSMVGMLLSAAVIGAGNSIHNINVLQGITGIYEGVKTMVGVNGSPGDTEKGLGQIARTIVSQAKGYVVPMEGMTKFVADIVDHPVQGWTSWRSAAVQGIPGLQGMYGTPTLNLLGEKMPRMFEKLAISKIFSYTNGDADLTWIANNRYTVPDMQNFQLSASELQNAGIDMAKGDKAPRQINDLKNQIYQDASKDLRAKVREYRLQYGISAPNSQVQDQLKTDFHSILAEHTVAVISRPDNMKSVKAGTKRASKE